MPDGWKQFKVEEEIGVFYRTSFKIYHDDCSSLCWRCRGSGEGMADGAVCAECKGRGELRYGGEGDRWYEVEWTKDDLSDLEITDGDTLECEACGYNFLEDIKEEVRQARDG